MDHQADANRTDLMTITRFVLNEQSKYAESRGDFTILINHIVLGCKFVCSSVNKVHTLMSFIFIRQNSQLLLFSIFTIDWTFIIFLLWQAGLAKILGLAGDTNVQVSFVFFIIFFFYLRTLRVRVNMWLCHTI